MAVALAAGRHAGARLGAGAFAGIAGDQRRYVDLDGAALEALFERDFEIVAQVRAAQTGLAAASAAAAAHEVAEDIFEDIGHRRGEFRAEAGRAAAAVLEGGMTEAVIGGALLRILQRVVGFRHFLEFVLGFGVPRIAVRMKLHRKLAVGALERRLVGAFGYAEHFVKIAFCQSGLFLHTPSDKGRCAQAP
jgi:hypothetical protein